MMSDAPQREAGIEVTDEMVDAGVAAYTRTRPSEASDFNERAIVQAVYLAMSKALRVSFDVSQTRENVAV